MDATETHGDGRGPSPAVTESFAIRICGRPGRGAANLLLLPECMSILKTCIPTASQISWESGSCRQRCATSLADTAVSDRVLQFSWRHGIEPGMSRSQFQNECVEILNWILTSV